MDHTKAVKLVKQSNRTDNSIETTEDNLRDIALFVAVAEAGSFSVAARNLGMPLSTLSWRISDFERALAVKLFSRTTRRVALTTNGWLHFERCRQLVREAHALSEDMRAQSQTPRGRLRLSTTTDFAICALAPLLPDFVARYPDISIDLDTSATRVDLLGDKVDLAIRMGPLSDSNLVARHLMDAHLNLYASPKYLRTHGVPGNPSELHEHHCVKTGPSPGDLTWKLWRGDEHAEVTLTARIWSNQMGLTRELLLNGLGVGVLVEEHYFRDIQDGRLVRVLPDWHFSPTAVSAVVPQRQVPAKTRVLIEFLLEKLPARSGNEIG